MTPASQPQTKPMSMRRRGALAVAFNAVFFVSISWWLYHNVKYADLLAQVQRIPSGAIMIAMAANLVVLTLYGLRIAKFLRAEAVPCFLVSNIGFTFNALIPFRIGEGIKIYFGSSYFGFPLGSLSAAILMEKLYDLSAIVAMAVVLGANSGVKISDIDGSTIAMLALVLVAFALLIAKLRTIGAAWRLPEWRILKRLHVDGFLTQAETLLANHDVTGALFFTATIWAMNAGLVFFLFSTLLPEAGFSLLDAISLLVIGALAIAVPASPAGLGIFEAGLVSYLTTVFKCPTEQAISAALAYHFCITAPHTVIAILFLGVVLARNLNARLMS